MNRRGSTLTEILAATVVFGVVATAGLTFMTAQHGAFSDGARRLEALRGLRTALDALEADVRTAGIHLAPGQPALVYAGPDVLAFSADHTSNRPDAAAVHVDYDAAATRVAAPSAPVPIGGTGWAWPHPSATDTRPGAAELIVFWFAPDPATPRADDYVLFRSVNGQGPESLANGVLRNGDRPFFEYDRRNADGTGTSRLVPLDATLLPLRHDAAVHASPADTGRAALIDDIRGVRVTVGFPDGGREPSRTFDDASLSRRVELPNVGLLDDAAPCGPFPAAVPQFTVRPEAGPDGERAIRLTWVPAPDDAADGGDVVRYVVWRSVEGADWGAPFVSIPAGRDRYTFLDGTVRPGQRVRYALAAQDCTPAFSRRASSATVTLR